ncbi:MAG: hypothetical protein GF330_02885 [Candidatus Eisenbacteria bacterium]|nr:hypothetical protein [Candidatus Eisenbacteria bacterium]
MRRPLLALLLIATWGLLPSAGGTSNAATEAARILSSLPAGDDAAQAAWIVRRARQVSDGALAYELMQEAAERRGPAAREARLWAVRYWASAGQLGRAREALAALGEGPPDSALADEARYWRARLLGEDARRGATEDRQAPPWCLMRALLELQQTPVEGWSLTRALSLEGASRRWGLLGPWLWILQRSSERQLLRAAEQIAAGARSQLVAAPETALLARRTLESPDGARMGGAPERRREDQAAAPSRFAVQIGSYDERRIAEALIAELATHGFRGHLSVGLPPDQPPVYRVRLGPYERIAEAESLGVRLARELMLPYQIVETP